MAKYVVFLASISNGNSAPGSPIPSPHPAAAIMEIMSHVTQKAQEMARAKGWNGPFTKFQPVRSANFVWPSPLCRASLCFFNCYIATLKKTGVYILSPVVCTMQSIHPFYHHVVCFVVLLGFPLR